jgi:hypothetical protein
MPNHPAERQPTEDASFADRWPVADRKYTAGNLPSSVSLAAIEQVAGERRRAVAERKAEWETARWSKKDVSSA